MKSFTESLIELLSHPGLDKFSPKLRRILLNLYKPRTRFWNFGLIGLVGMVINQFVLHRLIAFLPLLPLWVANSIGIFVAWYWNYQNSFGYLSKYW